MTGQEIQKALIDLGKPKGELYAEIGEMVNVYPTQCSTAIKGTGTGRRGENERMKILEAAEKVIKRWEEAASLKNKKG